MLADARDIAPGTTLEADVCVVGAGAAGITVARSFIGSAERVILLESGGLEYDSNTQALYKGPSVGLPYFPLEVARLRFFGGSTNHWGGLCAPFRVEDFESRSWIPHSGWPIDRSDLDPYYPEARRIVHLMSDDWNAHSWSARDSQTSFDLGKRTEPRIAQIVKTRLRSFGTTYRAEIERARNLQAFLHANVTEIETNSVGRRATSVRVATLANTHFSVRARVFVIAVGGIDNARLLLASNHVRPAGLGNDRDLVGRFFLEHPRFEAGVVLPLDPEVRAGFYEPHHVGRTEIQGYIALPPDVQRDEELVDVQLLTRPVYRGGFERALSSATVDSLRDLVRDREASVSEMGTNLVNVTRDLATPHRVTIPGAPLPVPYPEVVAKLFTSPDVVRDSIPDLMGDIAAFTYRRLAGAAPLDSIVLRTRLDPAPNPQSRVTLSAERDALGLPRAQLDWRLSAIDRHSAIRTIEIVGNAFAEAGLGRVRVLLDEGDEWPADMSGGWHHMGTTRMSQDPTTGVVDRNCRVHGLENLYIAGSSVFSTGGSSTPTLTIVALGLRLAEHLRLMLK